MSHAIDCSNVRSVLLADGWHRVNEGSFVIDTYEYVQSTPTIAKGGQNGIGFQFKDEGGYVLSGPLASVLATQAR